MALLSITGLTKNFGALRVLDGIHMEVQEGSLHSVVGPNGAGKTTLFNVISGFIKPTEGKVEFKREDITHLSPYQMAYKGISRSFQVITLFPELTTLENIRLAIQAKRKERFSFFKKASELKETVEQSHATLKLLGLDAKAEHKASELSHGEQRLLDIGVAMAGENTLLLLDEPSMGLAPMLVEKIFEIVVEINKSGTTIMLVEQNASMALSIANRAYVLETGEVVLSGDAGELARNPEVRKAYLGE